MRRRKWILGALAGMALIAGAMVALLSSDWFAERVRLAIIERTQSSTGGRAELTSFQFDWSAMRVTARGFTLHGL